MLERMKTCSDTADEEESTVKIKKTVLDFFICLSVSTQYDFLSSLNSGDLFAVCAAFKFNGNTQNPQSSEVEVFMHLTLSDKCDNYCRLYYL